MRLAARVSDAMILAMRAGGSSAYRTQGHIALACADKCSDRENKVRWLETAEQLFRDHVAYMRQQPWAR